MELKSTQFNNNSALPSKYTCDGEGISPLLQVAKIPEGTKTLALVVSDPDAPSGDFVHWLIADFKPTEEISEGSTPEGAVRGRNSSDSLDYIPACPPSGSHRYIFTLYALPETLGLKEGFTKQELEQKVQLKKIEQAVLVGLYERAR